MNTKILLRNVIARFLFFMRLTTPGRCGYGRLSIVTFHRVLPEASRQEYPYPGLVVTPEELDDFLTYFTRHFDCGALATQHERYLSGATSARPLLAITFDDAQHDNFRYALPVLARHQVKASFFVPVVAVERQELLWHDRLGFAVISLLRKVHGGREQLMRVLADAGLSIDGSEALASKVVEASKGLALEERLLLVKELVEASGSVKFPEFARLMTFEEIVILAAEGHEIGSHSMTHCMMPECDDTSLMYEISESRQKLQAHVGQQIESFCYPNGNADARTASAVTKSGYRRAVTTAWGCNGHEEDRYQLRRYDMTSNRVYDSNGEFMPALLAFRMSGLYPGLV